MMSDPLIDQLTNDLKPVQPLRNISLWRHCSACLILAIALILSVLGIRPDWLQAIQVGALLWKPAIFFLTLSGSMLLVTDISRPTGKIKPVHFVPLLLALAILIWRLTSAKIDFASLDSYSAYICLSVITSGGAMVMGMVWLFWLRKAATPHPALLGSLAGVSAGSLVAAAYSLHCNQDAGIYVSVYYIPPIFLLSLAGGVLGRNKLKW